MTLKKKPTLPPPQDFCGTTLTLNFLDEVAGLDASWSLEFASASAAEACINSIRPPWEELFSVPLQVNAPPALMASSSVSQERTWQKHPSSTQSLVCRRSCELIGLMIVRNVILIKRLIVTCFLYLYFLYGLGEPEFGYRPRDWRPARGRRLRLWSLVDGSFFFFF